AHGADINRRSDWWAGPFGILDGTTPAEAEALMARGAKLDVWSAAHLGRLDDLAAMLDADPELIHARGGDGQTPLSFAASPEVAEFLLARGARLDTRCVDHESTPAQWAVGDRPEVARYLVEQGAWFDIYLAIALDDAERVKQCLAAEPDCLFCRIGQGLYRPRHDNAHASTGEQIGEGRGNVIFWQLGGDLSPLEVAARRSHSEVFPLLRAHATPAQRLLVACETGDRERAEAEVAAAPDLVASLAPEEQGRLADMARDRNRAAVELMLALGFPIDARGQEGGTPLHWAAWRADLPLIELLLAHDPPLDEPDPTHHSPPLGWAVYGSQHGWDRNRADDYGPVVRRLIEAGCRPQAGMLPCTNPAVEAVLREATG
ncbi:MAG: ankyrin repeat domain-containing protein, partial [Armatimonadetes bacterium]|nr:ankyrin repeat domain-containing protein [Armatimonadota bacterium]